MVRWPFLIIGIITLLAGAAGSFAYFSDFLLLKEVSVSPDKYKDALRETSLSPGKNILNVPAEEAAEYLLHNAPAAEVKLRYELPGAIRIEVGDFIPIALIFGEDRQTIYGLDERSRVLPLADGRLKYELPLIGGIRPGTTYQKIPDHRLRLIMEQLGRLRREESDFYHSISSIDIQAGDSVMIHFDGLPCVLVMRPGGFYEGISGLKRLLLEFNVDLKKTTRLDFRSPGHIIARKKENKDLDKKDARVENNNGY
jgi:cell division septal protein FtsQ